MQRSRPERSRGRGSASGARQRAPVSAARSLSAVDRFYREGLAAGGRDNGAPGVRADYGPTYYAAFLRDPDGNNLEAVCLK